jgi:hypothetical protein
VSAPTITAKRGLLCEEVQESDLRAGDVFLATSDRDDVPKMIGLWASRESLLVHVWTGLKPGHRGRTVLRLRIG